MGAQSGTELFHIAGVGLLYKHTKRSIKDLDNSHMEASQFVPKIAIWFTEVTD